MEALQPLKRAGDQESLHLVAAEIVDQGVPVLMKPFPGILVLVERRSVELR